jgi:hypothetical protein
MVHKALHRKLKIEQHEPRRVCSFCSTSGTCHVKNLVISHTWGKDEIQLWQRHSFWINYFHLILTKINCITLKIHSKAEFKSKSENIWQQIILFSHTVMQMICTWPKISTLSGKLSLMRTVQLMKKMSDASKNIFRVYHIRIIAPKKKNGSHDQKHILLRHQSYRSDSFYG